MMFTPIASSLSGVDEAPAAFAAPDPQIVATVPTMLTVEATSFDQDILSLQEETAASLVVLSTTIDPAASSEQRMVAQHSAARSLTKQGKRVGTLIAGLLRLSVPANLEPRLVKLLRQARSLRDNLLTEGGASDPIIRLVEYQQETSAVELQLSTFQDAATTELNATGRSAVALQAASQSSMRSTARVTLSVTFGLGGEADLSAQANGVASLRSNALSLDFSYSSPTELAGTTLSERIVNGQLYLGTPQITAVVPHAFWMRLPFTLGNAGSPDGISNPLTQLKPSFGRGVTVTLIGPDTVDGTPSVIYGMTTTRATVIDQLRHTDLPGWETRSVEASIPAKGVSTVFWVDAENHLIQVLGGFRIPVPEEPAVIADTTLKLSHYGVSVTITEPPANRVISLQQYQKALRLHSATPALSI